MSAIISVMDVTWMSDQSVHLAEWVAALEQVTVRHLAKCPYTSDNVKNMDRYCFN